VNIIIAGGGEVGRRAAEVLAEGGHDVTVIDLEAEVLSRLEESVDLRTLRGNCAHAEIIQEAGGEACDLFVAATSQDEINLLAAAPAKAVGAKKCVARVHHGPFFEQRSLDYAAHFHIDRLVCPEHLTALAIARTLRNPGAIAVESFARGQIELQQFVVEADVPAVGTRLADLHLPRGVRLAVVERDTFAFIPDGETQSAEGDVVYLIGESALIENARRLFHQSKPKRTHVVVMGGPAMGVWLCRALKGRSFSVRLFETDEERAQELARKLEHVTVVQADPTDRTVFEEENIVSADAFVALTRDDEHNILGAAQAKSQGVRQTIAVVERPTYLHLLRHVGIDQAFSPRDVAAREIEGLIEDRPVRRLASLAEGAADVYEVRATLAGEATNAPLRKIRMPAHSLVAAIQRGDQASVPGATDAVRAGDRVIVIGPQGVDKEFRRLFVG